MIRQLIEKHKRFDHNSRAVIYNVLGAFVVKGGALIVTILATPAYIRFFNDNAALGVWYTLLSVITWILNFDLGIGNGLRNKLAASLAKDDKLLSKKYVSGAYFSIGFVVLIAAAVSCLTFDRVDWNSVFHIDPSVITAKALTAAVKIIFVGILFQFLLKLISSVLYAIQLSAVNNALALITSVISLLYVIFAKSYDNDKNIIIMAVVHTVSVLVPLTAATMIVFSTKLKDIRPSFRSFEMKYAKEILGLGGAFFIVQIEYMILINTNEYYISSLVDTASVVDYQIYFKLFTLIGTLATLTLTPIWSAVTKAFSEKNYAWISSLYKKLTLMGLICGLFEFLFIFAVQFVVNIWLKENTIQINYCCTVVFAVLGSCIVMNGVVSSFANGIGKLKTQMICFGLGAAAKLPLSVFFVNVLHSWIGVVIAVDIAMICFVIIQSAVNRKMIDAFNTKAV